ncbi:MAG: hypothetical protein K0S55_2012 [Clostridia bacterium]|jgi:uncharacterized protein|nr:hypothetical protein [Clostridia bacterium]
MEKNEMFLDISDILKSTEFQTAISCQIDISTEDSGFGVAKIEGDIINSGGIVNIKLDISGMYKTACDRCLEAVALPLSSKINTVLTYNESKDDSVYISNGKINLMKTAYDALALEIPIKVLCKEDCKGLCPNCGANLNIDKCNCF